MKLFQLDLIALFHRSIAIATTFLSNTVRTYLNEIERFCMKLDVKVI